MRIVYVLTTLAMGGAERQAVALAERMSARGHSVALIVLRPRVAEQWPTALPVVYLNLRKSPVSLLAALATARKILDDFHPDLIHSHTFHANIVARLLNGLAPPRVVSTVHNIYEGGWQRMIAYRLTDAFSIKTTAVCQAAADRYMRLRAVPHSKCIVMVNGIDPEEFAPSSERGARLRAEMGASGNFIWLAAGRLSTAKDYPNLLRAFALVRAKAINARLWIAGEASVEQASAMQALSGQLGLEDSVRWLGLRRDLPALLDAAGAFVLSSAWEGMPLAVAEAMAMQKPVVATDAGGTRELVGDRGVIVPPQNAEALAAAMLATMHSTAEARGTLGRGARQRILESFNIDARAREWEALYRSLTASS